MRHACETLEALGVPFEQQVVSAHRTPDLLFAYAASAEARGLQVIIAGAGGAAHLPGMAAAKTAAARARRAGRVEDAEGDGLAALDRADAGRRAGRHARDRACRARSTRRCSRRRSSRARDAGVRERLARVPRGADRGRARAPDPARDGLSRGASSACIGGGQLGRMLALAGIPLGLRFRFLDPAADACAGEVGELLVGAYDDPGAARPARRRRGVGHVRVRERPGRGGAARRRDPGRRALEAAQDRLAREGALPQPRHPDRPVRHARGDGACPRS